MAMGLTQQPVSGCAGNAGVPGGVELNQVGQIRRFVVLNILGRLPSEPGATSMGSIPISQPDSSSWYLACFMNRSDTPRPSQKNIAGTRDTMGALGAASILPPDTGLRSMRAIHPT